MKPKALRAVLAFAMALAATGAHAADRSSNFAIRGIGAETCQAFFSAPAKVRPYADLALQAWILGYVTAENRLSSNTYDIVGLQDPAVMPRLVGALCQANPNADIEGVVAGLITRLAPLKVAANSPLLTLHAGTASVAIRQETLVAVQKALARQGVYAGRANGEPTEVLQSALTSYQKKQQLPVSGLPDSATIIRLLIENSKLPAKS
ncbi:peptidoglycan-binding domain-containing protein [Acidocella sp.]|uniref:peptidoglycan-binding domain-containing protein n=1 Tax=Acidocella sp. TaxID=50710 RepID=UPI002626883F|nr:peptidoglycan-binding domain-containing protein [Acidocella sp.]